MKLNWENIDTVLIDMDGTILDLYFDNYFWHEQVPLSFSIKNGIDINAAKAQLKPLFKEMEGKLEWYCLDYWSDVLNLDISNLKFQLSDLISVLPHALEFLIKLRNTNQKIFLVTNAHRSSLNLKMHKTKLDSYFDEIISSHDYGFPKEDQRFWIKLQKEHYFSNNTTVLIDDNVAVLDSANKFGIQHLIILSKPDSKLTEFMPCRYPDVVDLRELMIGL